MVNADVSDPVNLF